MSMCSLTSSLAKFDVQNLYSTPQVRRKRPFHLRPRRMTLVDLRTGQSESENDLRIRVGKMVSSGSSRSADMGLTHIYGKRGILPIYDSTESLDSRHNSIRRRHRSSFLDGTTRFPKLEECAHFHYDYVELGPLHVSLCPQEENYHHNSSGDNNSNDGSSSTSSFCLEPRFTMRITSNDSSWTIRRTFKDFRVFDRQLHKCIYDRKYSHLPELLKEWSLRDDQEEFLMGLLSNYINRFSSLMSSGINCGPLLNWLELDNRGNRLLAVDDSGINTPAIAAAHAIKRYTAQATDEISLQVGDIVSVIDMPPPEDTIWWRGKRGFEVGFFPNDCVEVIGEKIPQSMSSCIPLAPTKPLLRRHGKLITFLRMFFSTRPSRNELKQNGIVKERVFGCDLGEHLLNSGHDVPTVLKCCSEIIEQHGIVDGIYRLSGISSNIQKLRLAFDEDRAPDLRESCYLQDIHSISSLLKMYFRELPNPLLTYQLYQKFADAVRDEDNKLMKIHDVVQQLPPPHYRTTEYLMRHLARVAANGHLTGMHSKNLAIVWAPNLLRCKELEMGGGAAALQGVGIQAVVTEFLICYADLIFSDKMPGFSSPDPQLRGNKKPRPKSLAISTPTRLLSLEEARERALCPGPVPPQKYIDVGGGPDNLPAKYHTVLDLPGYKKKAQKDLGKENRDIMQVKKSPVSGWKSFFSKSRSGSVKGKGRKTSNSGVDALSLGEQKAITEEDVHNWKRRRLRNAKSVESLLSLAHSNRYSLQSARTIDVPCPEERSSAVSSESGSPWRGLSNNRSRSQSLDRSAFSSSSSRETVIEMSIDVCTESAPTTTRPLSEQTRIDNERGPSFIRGESTRTAVNHRKTASEPAKPMDIEIYLGRKCDKNIKDGSQSVSNRGNKRTKKVMRTSSMDKAGDTIIAKDICPPLAKKNSTDKFIVHVQNAADVFKVDVPAEKSNLNVGRKSPKTVTKSPKVSDKSPRMEKNTKTKVKKRDVNISDKGKDSGKVREDNSDFVPLEIRNIANISAPFDVRKHDIVFAPVDSKKVQEKLITSVRTSLQMDAAVAQNYNFKSSEKSVPSSQVCVQLQPVVRSDNKSTALSVPERMSSVTMTTTDKSQQKPYASRFHDYAEIEDNPDNSGNKASYQMLQGGKVSEIKSKDPPPPLDLTHHFVIEREKPINITQDGQSKPPREKQTGRKTKHTINKSPGTEPGHSLSPDSPGTPGLMTRLQQFEQHMENKDIDVNPRMSKSLSIPSDIQRSLDQLGSMDSDLLSSITLSELSKSVDSFTFMLSDTEPEDSFWRSSSLDGGHETSLSRTLRDINDQIDRAFRREEEKTHGQCTPDSIVTPVESVNAIISSPVIREAVQRSVTDQTSSHPPHCYPVNTTHTRHNDTSLNLSSLITSAYNNTSYVAEHDPATEYDDGGATPTNEMDDFAFVSGGYQQNEPLAAVSHQPPVHACDSEQILLENSRLYDGKDPPEDITGVSTLSDTSIPEYNVLSISSLDDSAIPEHSADTPGHNITPTHIVTPSLSITPRHIDTCSSPCDGVVSGPRDSYPVSSTPLHIGSIKSQQTLPSDSVEDEESQIHAHLYTYDKADYANLLASDDHCHVRRLDNISNNSGFYPGSTVPTSDVGVTGSSAMSTRACSSHPPANLGLPLSASEENFWEFPGLSPLSPLSNVIEAYCDASYVDVERRRTEDNSQNNDDDFSSALIDTSVSLNKSKDLSNSDAKTIPLGNNDGQILDGNNSAILVCSSQADHRLVSTSNIKAINHVSEECDVSNPLDIVNLPSSPEIQKADTRAILNSESHSIIYRADNKKVSQLSVQLSGQSSQETELQSEPEHSHIADVESDEVCSTPEQDNVTSPTSHSVSPWFELQVFKLAQRSKQAEARLLYQDDYLDYDSSNESHLRNNELQSSSYSEPGAYESVSTEVMFSLDEFHDSQPNSNRVSMSSSAELDSVTDNLHIKESEAQSADSASRSVLHDNNLDINTSKNVQTNLFMNEPILHKKTISESNSLGQVLESRPKNMNTFINVEQTSSPRTLSNKAQSDTEKPIQVANPASIYPHGVSQTKYTEEAVVIARAQLTRPKQVTSENKHQSHSQSLLVTSQSNRKANAGSIDEQIHPQLLVSDNSSSVLPKSFSESNRDISPPLKRPFGSLYDDDGVSVQQYVVSSEQRKDGRERYPDPQSPSKRLKELPDIANTEISSWDTMKEVAPPDESLITYVRPRLGTPRRKTLPSALEAEIISIQDITSDTREAKLIIERKPHLKKHIQTVHSTKVDTPEKQLAASVESVSSLTSTSTESSMYDSWTDSAGKDTLHHDNPGLCRSISDSSCFPSIMTTSVYGAIPNYGDTYPPARQNINRQDYTNLNSSLQDHVATHPETRDISASNYRKQGSSSQSRLTRNYHYNTDLGDGHHALEHSVSFNQFSDKHDSGYLQDSVHKAKSEPDMSQDASVTNDNAGTRHPSLSSSGASSSSRSKLQSLRELFEPSSEQNEQRVSPEVAHNRSPKPWPRSLSTSMHEAYDTASIKSDDSSSPLMRSARSHSFNQSHKTSPAATLCQSWHPDTENEHPPITPRISKMTYNTGDSGFPSAKHTLASSKQQTLEEFLSSPQVQHPRHPRKQKSTGSLGSRAGSELSKPPMHDSPKPRPRVRTHSDSSTSDSTPRELEQEGFDTDSSNSGLSLSDAGQKSSLRRKGSIKELMALFEEKSQDGKSSDSDTSISPGSTVKREKPRYKSLSPVRSATDIKYNENKGTESTNHLLNQSASPQPDYKLNMGAMVPTAAVATKNKAPVRLGPKPFYGSLT